MHRHRHHHQYYHYHYTSTSTTATAPPLPSQGWILCIIMDMQTYTLNQPPAVATALSEDDASPWAHHKSGVLRLLQLEHACTHTRAHARTHTHISVNLAVQCSADTRDDTGGVLHQPYRGAVVEHCPPVPSLVVTVPHQKKSGTHSLGLKAGGRKRRRRRACTEPPTPCLQWR